MDTNPKEKLKAHIHEKIKRLKKDIASYRLLAKPVSPDNAIGRLTRMEAISSRSINEAALNRTRETLAKLERALTRINAPDFGLCRECEEPIPTARLMALPETELCVRCAGNIVG